MRRSNFRSMLNSALRHLFTLAIVVVMAGRLAPAQELEPRAYANLPVGLNFLQLGYSYSAGNVLFDPQIPLENVTGKVNSINLVYIRALGVAGKSARLLFALPYAGLSATGILAGEPVSRDVSGPGDPALGFAINFSGAPALSPKEFARYRQDLNLGVTFAVRPPLGQYDEDKAVNIGSNRWAFKTEAGASKVLGSWTVETSLAATVFTDNREYLVDRVRKQDPVYALQLHAVYDFPSQIWAGLSATFYRGGAVSIITRAGEEQELIGPRNSRAGATLSLPIDRRNSVKFQGSTSLSTRAGTSFDIFMASWQYSWGAGF